MGNRAFSEGGCGVRELGIERGILNPGRWNSTTIRGMYREAITESGVIEIYLHREEKDRRAE
jgi:hypothetical protein